MMLWRELPLLPLYMAVLSVLLGITLLGVNGLQPLTPDGVAWKARGLRMIMGSILMLLFLWLSLLMNQART